ncbi:MAG: beta-lactamase family protein [Deltaproteobacteria bacterium]|nr:beta-lactamase family protein [Deltaproteobacteria bacterium]MBW2447967.1 beta-lactamase family protein [Deltaproteobacteria bacterium]
MARSEQLVRDPRDAGLDPAAIDALAAKVAETVGRYDGCGAQIAVARRGRAVLRSFGSAPIAGDVQPVSDQTLFCTFSVTKAFTSSAAWMLLEAGRLGLEDPVARHVPGFDRHGKGAVTVEQLLTHTAGFPSAVMESDDFLDEATRLECMAEWKLEWEPGNRFVYHGAATMLVLAHLVSKLAGGDYRRVLRERIFEPLGATDLWVGLPEAEHARAADVVVVGEPQSDDERAVNPVDAPSLTDESVLWANRAPGRSFGHPGGGAFATAADVALFYQGVIAALDGAPGALWSQAMARDACTPRNVELVDPMTGHPALRGLGVTVAGEKGQIWRGFAPANGPRAVGHMGAGGQCAWGDPDSGISFTFLTNGAERSPARQGANAMGFSQLAAGAALD